MNGTENHISARGVSVAYGKKIALDDVSLDIPRGGIVALIGASGSGKSTFLRAVNRMHDERRDAAVSGEIIVGGEDALAASTDVVALRRRVGMVFQNPTPFPKSVYDNVAFGPETLGVRNRRKKIAGLFGRGTLPWPDVESSGDPLDALVVQCLKEAALWDEVKDRLHEQAHRLSGGQQQRLCIARALASRPEALLLDEPCSELDPISTRKIEQTLLALKGRYTVVIVTHNLHQARRIADRTAFFHLGKLVEYGDTKDVFERPVQELTREYVGGAFG